MSINIKKITEELNQILNEIEIDPSFKDYIDLRRDQQKQKNLKDAEHYKKNAELYKENPEKGDKWYFDQYNEYLKKAMGKHEADEILKTLYSKCHINLEAGGIKEVPIPKNVKELKSLITPDETAVILKKGSYISVIKGAKVNDKIEVYAAYSPKTYDTSFKDSALEQGWGSTEWSSTELDLSKPNNVSRALNKGLFDKAWLVYGGSTQKMMQDRKVAFSGSTDDLRRPNDYYSWNRDKSGYIKRDLKKDLADLNRNVEEEDFNAAKGQVVDIRKKLISQIKQSDIDDIATKDLESIVLALKDVENSYFRSWDYDDIKNSKKLLQAKLVRLNFLVDSLFNKE